MSSASVQALASVVETLAAEFHAYLLEGVRREALAWSELTEISVRISARTDDELWVLAGSGILVRFVAASDGDFGDVAPVVGEILRGQALEHFALRRGSGENLSTPAGFSLPGGFAGGIAASDAAWTAELAGPFGDK